MDLLTRVKNVLSGNKTNKRKSTFAEEFDSIKKSRVSDMNGDYSNDLFNSGFHYESPTYMRNSKRRTESFLTNQNHVDKPSFLAEYTSQNETNTNYNAHNYRDEEFSKFKQPMPPSNGSKRIPALISATKSTFSRGFNKPQQTVTPHYSRFGEPSELLNFKNLPELHPIQTNRTNAYASTSGSLFNGHDNSSLHSTRYNSQLLQSTGLNHSNFLPNTLATSGSTKMMGLKGNSLIFNSGQMNPPQNLSLSRYKSILDMIPGREFLRKFKSKAGDDSNHGIIDISEEADIRENKTSNSSSSPLPNVERVNSLKARLETNAIFKEGWEKSVNEKYSSKSLSRRDSIKQVKEKADECERMTRDIEDKLKESLKKIEISSRVYEEEEEEEPVNDYPRLEQEMLQKINYWIHGRDVQTVLMSKFNLSISRHDIQTLQWNPLTWLNDEVINFYMELLAERSRSNEKMPKVHAMNTFFLKRLLENGYTGVRRWTRKVDIFAHDIIPVPVHKGIHWCMAIIHMKNKTIKYYDSMGAPNNGALNALVEYLKAESLDKKKVEFDMNGWTTENVRNIPQQENGSDCGVFSCMYAEFVTRNRPIVFSQQHMQYFRMKMVYEICTGQMLN